MGLENLLQSSQPPAADKKKHDFIGPLSSPPGKPIRTLFRPIPLDADALDERIKGAFSGHNALYQKGFERSIKELQKGNPDARDLADLADSSDPRQALAAELLNKFEEQRKNHFKEGADNIAQHIRQACQDLRDEDQLNRWIPSVQKANLCQLATQLKMHFEALHQKEIDDFNGFFNDNIETLARIYSDKLNAANQKERDTARETLKQKMLEEMEAYQKKELELFLQTLSNALSAIGQQFTQDIRDNLWKSGPGSSKTIGDYYRKGLTTVPAAVPIGFSTDNTIYNRFGDKNRFDPDDPDTFTWDTRALNPRFSDEETDLALEDMLREFMRKQREHIAMLKANSADPDSIPSEPKLNLRAIRPAIGAGPFSSRITTDPNDTRPMLDRLWYIAVRVGYVPKNIDHKPADGTQFYEIMKAQRSYIELGQTKTQPVIVRRLLEHVDKQENKYTGKWGVGEIKKLLGGPEAITHDFQWPLDKALLPELTPELIAKIAAINPFDYHPTGPGRSGVDLKHTLNTMSYWVKENNQDVERISRGLGDAIFGEESNAKEEAKIIREMRLSRVENAVMRRLLKREAFDADGKKHPAIDLLDEADVIALNRLKFPDHSMTDAQIVDYINNTLNGSQNPNLWKDFFIKNFGNSGSSQFQKLKQIQERLLNAPRHTKIPELTAHITYTSKAINRLLGEIRENIGDKATDNADVLSFKFSRLKANYYELLFHLNAVEETLEDIMTAYSRLEADNPRIAARKTDLKEKCSTLINKSLEALAGAPQILSSLGNALTEKASQARKAKLIDEETFTKLTKNAEGEPKQEDVIALEANIKRFMFQHREAAARLDLKDPNPNATIIKVNEPPAGDDPNAEPTASIRLGHRG